MKVLFYICFLLWGVCGFSQEFKAYQNGLIYTPQAMAKLKEVVQERTQEFNTCKNPKAFKSVLQTKGRVFYLNAPDRKALVGHLKKNIALKDFLRKYAPEEHHHLYLLTKHSYVDEEGEPMIRITEQPEGNSLTVLEGALVATADGQWLYFLSKAARVTVVYIATGFITKSLPAKYANMLRYTECLIDTNSQVFVEQASRRRFYQIADSLRRHQLAFLNYVGDTIGFFRGMLPVPPPPPPPGSAIAKEVDVSKWMDSVQTLKQQQLKKVREVYAKRALFYNLLNKAYQEALDHKSSSDNFEYYVATYMEPEMALTLKRNRLVVGTCSMDDSPRQHLVGIGELAAASGNWDVFIRSHLNLLNDYVSRVSDGSWAWEGRTAPIEELEALQIKVPQLVLGVGLRANNVAQGHYFGNLGRLGRAMAGSKYRNPFGKALKVMLQDKTLDDYNRMLLFFMYDHFLYHSYKVKDKAFYKKARAEGLSSLPSYLQVVINKGR